MRTLNPQSPFPMGSQFLFNKGRVRPTPAGELVALGLLSRERLGMAAQYNAAHCAADGVRSLLLSVGCLGSRSRLETQFPGNKMVVPDIEGALVKRFLM